MVATIHNNQAVFALLTLSSAYNVDKQSFRKFGVGDYKWRSRWVPPWESPLYPKQLPLLLTDIRSAESEMNGSIAEKIGREDDAPLTNKRHSMMKGSKAPASIREYFSTQINQISLPSWRTMPEIPTSSEVGMLQSGKPVLEPIPISPNIVEGAWEDSQQYFQSHYELLREDGVAPLRDAVAEVRAKPRMMEADSQEYAGIYENVSILQDLSLITKLA